MPMASPNSRRRCAATWSQLLCLTLVSIVCHKAVTSWVIPTPQGCKTARLLSSSSLFQPIRGSQGRQTDATSKCCYHDLIWIRKISKSDDVNYGEEEAIQTTKLTTRREWMQRLSGAVTTATLAVTAAGAGAFAFSPRAWAATTTTQESPAAAKLVISPSVCDAAVSVWQRDGRLVYLLGTAHISSTSAQTAGNLVDEVQPKAVFVELDIKRVGGASTVLGKRLDGEDGGNAQEVTTPDSVRWVIPQPNKNILSSSTQQILVEDDDDEEPEDGATKNKKKNPLNVRQQVLQAGAAAVGNSIKSMYQRLDQSGFQAGEEFVNAIREGQKIGAAIVLGDRDVEVTLRRLTLALSQTDLGSLFSPDNELEQSMRALLPPQARDIVEQGNGGADALGLTDAEFKEELSTYVETLRTKENVRTIMKQLKRIAPALYQVMLAERDAYMAGGLDTLGQFQTIVAVMGMAHIDGVEQNLQELGWKSVPLLKCNNVINRKR